MKFRGDRIKALDGLTVFPDSSPVSACNPGTDVAEQQLRIALVTPYNGGNLGDAVIQDSVIANFRRRLPGVQFSGICLNTDNFIERHGTDAFPMCAVDIPFYGMLHGTVNDQSEHGVQPQLHSRGTGWRAATKNAVKRLRPLWILLKRIRTYWHEFRHWVQGYRFVRRHDLIIVSGGGQINEEWGGAWGQPFALFKWAVLARCARVPYVITSVGLGKIKSRTACLFMSATLRMARYRSYRDKNTKAFATTLLRPAEKDPVVADHALALPSSEIPGASGIRRLAQGRPIIAISPIAYAKPQKWPTENRTIYERYMVQMAQAMSQLLDSGYFLVIVCSSLWDDESAIGDLLGHLDERSTQKLSQQTYMPSISTWRDLVASLLDVDILIASRLHSVILGFVAQTPTVAISFEPKVEWVMEELAQTEYLVRIRDFVAADITAAVERISIHRKDIVEHVRICRNNIISDCAAQYNTLAQFAVASRPDRTQLL